MEVKIPPLVSIVAHVSDWRKARGRRYQLHSLLALVVLGLLCGKKGVRAMARFGRGLPKGRQRRLGLAPDRAPSVSTLCRLLWYVEVAQLEAGIQQWAQAVHEQLIEAGVSEGIAIDGKSIRRAASLGADNVHLLSAVCHQLRLVLAQSAVEDKTNEITAIHPLLERLLLEGMVITVDALLTQRKIAAKIRRLKGDYLMLVKENQPKLLWALSYLFERAPTGGLPKPATAKTVGKGHGRVEVREMKVSSVLNEYLDWPSVAQVFQLKRRTYYPASGKESQETVYGLTSLSPQAASPAQLLAHLRQHWAAIENGLHWPRDVVMGEDASKVHKGTAPQALAALRNLAINLARLAGFDSITAALDAFSANPDNALDWMGL